MAVHTDDFLGFINSKRDGNITKTSFTTQELFAYPQTKLAKQAWKPSDQESKKKTWIYTKIAWKIAKEHNVGDIISKLVANRMRESEQCTTKSFLIVAEVKNEGRSDYLGSCL